MSNLALCLLKDNNMSGVVTVYGELYGGNVQGGVIRLIRPLLLKLD